jgi:hypothetical protein
MTGAGPGERIDDAASQQRKTLTPDFSALQ